MRLSCIWAQRTLAGGSAEVEMTLTPSEATNATAPSRSARAGSARPGDGVVLLGRPPPLPSGERGLFLPGGHHCP